MKSLFKVSLASLVTLSATILLQAAPVAAAETATVTYDKGATTVWSSPSVGQNAQSYVQKGDSVTIDQTKTVWGTTWYQISEGGWIPENYLSVGKTTTPATQHEGQITLSYTGGAITKWDSFKAQYAKGYLASGTTVAYTQKTTATDGTWYELTDGSWVSEQFTTAASATTAAPSTQTQPVSQSTKQAQSTTSAVTQRPATTKPTYSTNNAYPWGQCTYYVKSVAPWVGNYWGNGNQWGASAAAAGFQVDNQPAAGAVISFAAGQMIGTWQADASYGHVAYVQAYNAATNTVTITQGGMGFSNPTGPNTQVLNNASQFTYIHA
ncbi:hypothetical protein FC34_GL000858 [Lacticaseibacillus brantae DSM 23927]|uniref:Peptidase C51 domain-containing protein n=1 Tax=Lacticaseibacillus brantae DSM 23927 TaxID=1423727 RepID=A0A0R2AYN0_9LACO|nr:hypothetical protein FC34_GL000858 [Lacticaseibacillus brantae DSM 23927]